jgi:hypothetical protein
MKLAQTNAQNVERQSSTKLFHKCWQVLLSATFPEQQIQ